MENTLGFAIHQFRSRGLRQPSSCDDIDDAEDKVGFDLFLGRVLEAEVREDVARACDGHVVSVRGRDGGLSRFQRRQAPLRIGRNRRFRDRGDPDETR